MHECDQKELLNELRRDIKKILQQTARLEVKAGIWGLFGGCVPVIVALLLKKI